jgi:uncharacterized protein DUF6166
MRIRGYRNNQRGGACLVTVVDELGDEKVLPPAVISPKHEVRHSPDGFQWGYAGSGPAELARAILVRVIEGDDRARHPRCYQLYKADVVQRIQKDEFELSFKSVREWYDRWLISHGKVVEPGWRT